MKEYTRTLWICSKKDIYNHPLDKEYYTKIWTRRLQACETRTQREICKNMIAKINRDWSI